MRTKQYDIYEKLTINLYLSSDILLEQINLSLKWFKSPDSKDQENEYSLTLLAWKS